MLKSLFSRAKPTQPQAPTPAELPIPPEMPNVNFFVEEFLCHRRYMRAEFHVRPIFGLASASVDYGGHSYALDIRERGDCLLLTGDFLTEGIATAHEAKVVMHLDQNQTIVIDDIVRRQLPAYDDLTSLYIQVQNRIGPKLPALDVLEIGSRLRDATLRSWESLKPSAKSYTGIDIVEGPNVDFVGDAHRLADLLPGRQFDFVYSQYVFEHLAMPWVAAVEINKVLRVGGEAFIMSNQSIGLHDRPWDFWRFSDSAWKSLFNTATGFEIITVAMGDPVRLPPLRYHEGFSEHEGGAGFQGSAVYARKITDCALSWDVPPEAIYRQLERSYPREITD